MHSRPHSAHPWLWPAQSPAPLKVAASGSETVHSGLYRGRRITIRSSGVTGYAFRAFVDGWPVSNRRRGATGGFPSVAQAIGRCRIVIDGEAPARRWRLVQRALRRVRTACNQAITGDRRAGAVRQVVPPPRPG